ncbi:PEGA domain-containing protein [Archangium violaceum]|uniref:PEGA domain-containing protein n=1 Tax=Archangium violaceum TaxID=83451 RepID=UPI00194E1CA0|nr:PEGA domain-containing protein [Archangium violaceum]QRN96109.1 PEGA domain-containing protein [Archangium violaceum]
MRTPVVYVAGLLALALAAGPARAQEGLGLDLSGDSNGQKPNEQQDSEDAQLDTGNLGLDLSGSTSGVDLRSRFAFLGVDTPDRAGAAVSKRWLGWLQAVAFRSGVSRAADVGESRSQLGADYDSALRCGEASCFGPAAETLDADLLTTARLAQEDGTWTLRLWTYDRDRGVVETDVVTGRKANDGNFIRESGNVLTKRLTGLARQRSLLKVSSNVPQAVVRVGERMLGVGKVEAKLPPGEVQLIVEADDYSTYTKTLTLAPGATEEVQVRLELNGPSPDGPPADAVAVVKKSSKKSSSGGPSVFSRPALYTTVVGLAAVGAGVALGMSARNAAATGVDGQGVQSLTRSEYLAARQQSMLASGLMAGGGAVAAGSLLWLIIVPARSEPASSSLAPVTSGAGKGSTDLHLVIGGSF